MTGVERLALSVSALVTYHRSRITPFCLAFAAALGAFLAGCTAGPDHPALKDAQLPSLIPAHRFAYRGAGQGGYLFSPDGGRLTWYEPYFGRSFLHVRDNHSGTVRRFRVGGPVQWTPDGRRLLYTADTSGAENPHIYLIDLDDPDAKPVDITPWGGVRAGIHQILPGPPVQVLVYHNRRDRKLFDLYSLDLATRKETLVSQNPGDGTAPLTAADGTFKGWATSRAAQRRATEAPKPLDARKADLVNKPDEAFRSLGLSVDRSILWALSSRGRDRMALVAVEPRLGWEKVVFEDPVADVSAVTMSRITGAPLVAQALPGYPRVRILDQQLREDLAPLLRAQGDGPHALHIASFDADERRMVVTIGSDTQRRAWLVDRQARTHVLLTQSLESDLEGALTAMRPVTIPSQDGLTLHGYLTLPRGTTGKGLPMVVHVHGGPWLRTQWSDPFSSDDALYAQFLANRGYAVLQVDFRGSVGYGRSFSRAGIGEFAGRMQQDLLDAVRWAIDHGVADPARVAIMGWSYGGYAALTALATTPDVFACGVSIAGPTDLANLIESFPPYWKVDLSQWLDFVGDPEIAEDRAQMKRKSPLYLVENITRPVLIVHGVRDVRVRVDQSDRMVAALRQSGKPVEDPRIPDMGHGVGWWPHSLETLRATERFLGNCLGGRVARFDWFDPVAWAWVKWSRFREQGEARKEKSKK